MAPTPALEPSVITHMGSGLSAFMGFKIGARQASALIVSKHLSNSGVHSNGRLFHMQPANGVVYAVISGI